MDRAQLFATFVQVVDSKSLSRAAERLGCSLAAVSRQLAELEAILGTRLVDRSARAMRVTAAGETLYPQAVVALGAIERAIESVRGEAGGAAVVRVSVPVALGLMRVVPAVSRLLSTRPGLRVEVLLENETISLEGKGVDVVVRAGRATLPDSAEVVARSLGAYRFVVCAAPKTLAREGTLKRPEDLAGRATALHVSLRGTRGLPFSRGRDRITVMPEVRLWTNDVLASRNVARDGDLLTVVPEWLVEEEVERGRLVVLLAGWSLPPGVASVAYRRHAGGRPAVRAVVDHLATTTAFGRRR